MVRTQIQLTVEQAKVLKKLAQTRGVSMAELVRQGVDRIIEQGDAAANRRRRSRALRAVGRFRSGRRDLSVHHDRYLAEALKA